MADDVRSPSRDLSALRIQRDPDRPRSRAPWILLVLVLAGGAGLGGWIWYHGKRGIELEAGWVRLAGCRDTGGRRSASGYIIPDRKADVSSRMFGTLEWVGIEVGSTVKKGDVIGRIANADIAAMVEEAKASQSDAEREYERLKKIVEAGIERK